MKFVHVKCLKEWIRSSGSVQCEICHSLYKQCWIEWAFEKGYLINKVEEDNDQVVPVEGKIQNAKILIMVSIVPIILFYMLSFLFK